MNSLNGKPCVYKDLPWRLAKACAVRTASTHAPANYAARIKAVLGKTPSLHDECRLICPQDITRNTLGSEALARLLVTTSNPVEESRQH